PVLGMMTGLGLLQFFGFFLRKTLPGSLARKKAMAEREGDIERIRALGQIVPFDVFNRIARAEWDTLLFFYGVVMCVGGLGYIGYLEMLSTGLYGNGNPTTANVILGLMSSVVDNIPVMFAVLTMAPDMSHGQWLLIVYRLGGRCGLNGPGPWLLHLCRAFKMGAGDTIRLWCQRSYPLVPECAFV